jgi:hypothetical protein
MANDLQIYTLAIVLIGDFNPVIMSPIWLSSKGLIREEEARKAKVELIHNDITRYELSWARVEVTQKRFEIRTSQEPYFEPLKDLAISIFDILRETPLNTVGINHLLYYAISREETYYEFGNKFAPLVNWKDILNEPRVLGLDIIELKRKDGLKGKFRVKLSPSDIPLATPFGVLIHTNDEVGLQLGETGKDREIIKHLANMWRPSMERANKVVEYIWSKLS